MGAAPSKETISLFSYFRGSYEVGLIPLTRYYFGKDDEEDDNGEATARNTVGGIVDASRKATSSHSLPVAALLPQTLLDLVNDDDDDENDQHGTTSANTVASAVNEATGRSEGNSSDDDEPRLPVFCISDTDSDEDDTCRPVTTATRTTRSAASKLAPGAPPASLFGAMPSHDAAPAGGAPETRTSHRVQRQLLRAQLIQMRHDPAVRYTNARSRANMLFTLRQHLSGASPQSSLPPMELNKPVEEVTDEELEPYLERYFWDVMPESDFTEDDLDHFLDLVDEALYETDEAMVKDAYYDAGSALGVCAGVEAAASAASTQSYTNGNVAAGRAATGRRRFMPIPCALCLAYPEGKERSGCFALDGRNINIIGYFGLLTAEMQRAFKVSKCGGAASATTGGPAIGQPGSCFPLRGDLALHLNTAILTSAGDRTLERVLVLAAVMFRQQFHTACRRAYLSRIFAASATRAAATVATSAVNSSNNSSFSARSAWLRSGAIDAIVPDAQEQLRLLMQPIGPSSGASANCGLGSIGQCLAPPFLAAAADSGNLPASTSPPVCPTMTGHPVMPTTMTAGAYGCAMGGVQQPALTVPSSVASNALTPLSPSSPPHSDPLFARPLPSLPAALHEQTPTYQANLGFYAEANLNAARSAIPSHTQLYHSLRDGVYQLANDNLPLLPQEEEERIVWAFYRRLQRIALVIETSSINYSSLKSLTENFAFLHCQVPIDPAGAYMDLIDLPEHSAYGPTQTAARPFAADCGNYTRRAAVASEVTSYAAGERNSTLAYALSMRSAVVVYMQPAYFCQATLWASCLFHYPSRLPGGQWIQYKLKDECMQLRQILQSKDTLIADWRRVNQAHASRYLGPNTQRLLAHVQCLQEETERARNLPMEHWNHTHVFLNKDGRKYALHRSPYGTMLIGVRVYNGGSGNPGGCGGGQMCGSSGVVGGGGSNGHGGGEYHYGGCTATHHHNSNPAPRQSQQRAAYALCYPPGNMYGGAAGYYAELGPGGRQLLRELAEYDPSARTPGPICPSALPASHGGREECGEYAGPRAVHVPTVVLPVNGALSAVQLGDVALAYATHQHMTQAPSPGYLVSGATLPPPPLQSTVAVTPASCIAAALPAHTPSLHESAAGGSTPTMATVSGVQLSRQTTSLSSTEQPGVRVSLALPPYSTYSAERGAVPHVAAAPSLASSAASPSGPDVAMCNGNAALQKAVYQHVATPCSRGMSAETDGRQAGLAPCPCAVAVSGLAPRLLGGPATQAMPPSLLGQQQQHQQEQASLAMARYGGGVGPMVVLPPDVPHGGFGGGRAALPVPRHCLPAVSQPEVPVIVVGEAGRQAEPQARILRTQADNEGIFLCMPQERRFLGAVPSGMQSPPSLSAAAANVTADRASGQRQCGAEEQGSPMYGRATGHVAAPTAATPASPLQCAHATSSSSSSGSPPCAVVVAAATGPQHSHAMAAAPTMTKPAAGYNGRATATPPQYRAMQPRVLAHTAVAAAQPQVSTDNISRIDCNHTHVTTPLSSGDRGMYGMVTAHIVSPHSQPRQTGGLTNARLANCDPATHAPHSLTAEACVMTRANAHDGKARAAAAAANEGVFATRNGLAAQQSVAWVVPRTSQQFADFAYSPATR